MIRLIIIAFVIWVGNGGVYAQSDYTNCAGNIDITANVSYELSFKGSRGKNQSSIEHYCKLPIDYNNFIYLHYSPPNDGQISLDFFNIQDSLHAFIFEVLSSQDCKAIAQKKAKMLAVEFRSSQDSTLQEHPVYANRNYYIVLYRDPSKSAVLSLKVNYRPLDKTGKNIRDSLLLNLISNYDTPIYEVHLRNVITREPVVAKIAIYASSNLDGTYQASDLLLNNQKKLRANLQIVAEGYYPLELNAHTVMAGSQADTFFLIPISQGSITKLDDIFFIGGLAIILDESLPRLKKLRDFLVLNESVSIEIQGHVNDEGANSLSSKRLSKKRAKKIMEYLIDSGVEPFRLSAVGLGNTRPIYPNPETDEQKEANRRVEIKIK
ncbi:MAG: OmpA family protein [Bacteroidetes bacterium]|nr:OmpA family protein [Bacteroidota bacterium]